MALVLIPLILGFVGAWKAVAKAGYPGLLALLLFVPCLNLIMLLVFGNADWPVLKRLRELEQNRIPPETFKRSES